MTTHFETVEAYLAAQTEEAQIALERLREAIKTIAPEAVESLSYQMPAFKYRGKPLIYIGAFKKHCSIFPTNSPILHVKNELTTYKTSKGAINMPFDHVFPTDLLKKIIMFRMSDIDFELEKKKKP